MKTLMIAIAASAVLAGSAAVAQTAPATPPAATAPYYTAEDSTMGDLLDSPEAKAVLAKHVPDLLKNDGIERARGMTLASLQQYAPEIVTDEKLKLIDKDLAVIPAPKP